jgi:hypothetical protein
MSTIDSTCFYEFYMSHMLICNIWSNKVLLMVDAQMDSCSIAWG